MTHSAHLVLGGVGGIGEALARRLRARGNRVVITSRAEARVAPLAREIGAIGLVADPLDEASLAAAVETASEGGELTGIVYAIGTIPLKPLARTTEADMLEAFRINVVGALQAVKVAAPALRRGGGSAVLFSSIAARHGFPNHAAISAAKAAVEGLTVALAAELAPAVRVNAIAPSLTATPLAAPLTSNPRMAEAIAAQHPLPRLGDADEVAALAELLLSPAARWITGQVFAVDGGRSTLRVGRS